MARKAVLSVLLVFQLTIVLVSLPSLRLANAAKTWYVNDDGGADFTRIQDAIDAASSGDVVYVYNGTYSEHVIVSKSLTINGESTQATIINGISSKVVLTIEANDVQVDGFTVRNGSRGILVSAFNGSIISNNNITQNDGEGLFIEDSENNTSTNNWISYNGGDGAYIWNSSNTILRGNTITFNNPIGVFFEDSSNAIVDSNTLGNNTYHGIRLYDSDHISVVRNTIRMNLAGVDFSNITSSVFYHNNFANNTEPIRTPTDGSTSTWDNGIEGNYWSNYTGTDLHTGSSPQTLAGSDGIGDTPYAIDLNNQDKYPFMGPISFFDAGTWNSQAYSLNIASNSTLSDFTLNQTERAISFNATDEAGLGFCRVTIPNAVVQGLFGNRYKVLVDGVETVWTKWVDATHNYIYFTYAHPEHEVVIQALELEAPIISILSPENRTYASRDVALNFTLSEPTSWIGYSLDGLANETINGNSTLAGLNDGKHRVTVCANDTASNMGYSDPIYFTVDTVSPVIEVLSPQNITYTASSVSLNVTVDEPTSWIGFSLDGQANQTISVNGFIISDLSNGSHNLRVYANDTVGNVGASEILYFTINVPSPPQQVEPFPIWVAVVAVIMVGAIVAVMVYLVRFRKKDKELSDKSAK